MIENKELAFSLAGGGGWGEALESIEGYLGSKKVKNHWSRKSELL